MRVCLPSRPPLSKRKPVSSARPIALLNARLIDPERETETRGGLIAIDGLIAGRRRRGHARFGFPPTPASSTAPATSSRRASSTCAPSSASRAPSIARRSRAPAPRRRRAASRRSSRGPDTNPPVDDPAVVDFILRRARDAAKVRILPSAALTKGLQGQEIAEIGLLAEAGAVAFSDGPHSIANAQTMRRALTYARDFGALIMHYLRGP